MDKPYSEGDDENELLRNNNIYHTASGVNYYDNSEFDDNMRRPNPENAEPVCHYDVHQDAHESPYGIPYYYSPDNQHHNENDDYNDIELGNHFNPQLPNV